MHGFGNFSWVFLGRLPLPVFLLGLLLGVVSTPKTPWKAAEGLSLSLNSLKLYQ